jgi:hypothetical protein
MVAAFPIKDRIVVRQELMDGEAKGTTPDRPPRRMPIITGGDIITITKINPTDSRYPLAFFEIPANRDPVRKGSFYSSEAAGTCESSGQLIG